MEERGVYKYKTSKDKRGLIAFCNNKSGRFNYHIHSREFSKLEKWIYRQLKNIGE